MRKINEDNIERIELVARNLGHLVKKMVFIGGIVIDFYISDEAAPEVRPTIDVDLIVEITSYKQFSSLEKELRNLGFKHSKEMICRWYVFDQIVDIMPTDENILGFSNKWYKSAINNSENIFINKETEIRIATPPFILGTKIEAFKGRGNNDFLASRDIEDIISLIDGRKELISEIKSAPNDLKAYLSREFGEFLKNGKFIESIAGHLHPDPANQARQPLTIKKMREIIILS